MTPNTPSDSAPSTGSSPSKGLVAITGATGFVGRALTAELLSRGWSVRGLTRSIVNAKAVLPVDAIANGSLQLVEGDALEPGVLEQLVDGAQACVNLIGIIRESSGRHTFERAHTMTTQAVVTACEGSGCTRLLQMSALGVSAHGETEYRKTKYAGELAVQLSSLDWTIFRPGLIHGPSGEFMKLAQGWCEGRTTPRLFIPYFSRIALIDGIVPTPTLETPTVAPVRVEDVAGAFASALEAPDAVGEIYNLVGSEEIAFDSMLATIRDSLPLGRRSMRVIGIPGQIAACKAKAADLVGMGGLLPFDEGMAIMGQQDLLASNTKAHEDLGFDPQPFTDSFKSYAASM